MGSIPIVSNGVNMASSLRGLASKKKQPVENQNISREESLVAPVETQVSIEASEISPASSEAETAVEVETLSSETIDAVQALEVLSESAVEVTTDLSVDQSVEVAPVGVSTKKTKKQNSKKKGMENQS